MFIKVVASQLAPRKVVLRSQVEEIKFQLKMLQSSWAKAVYSHAPLSILVKRCPHRQCCFLVVWFGLGLSPSAFGGFSLSAQYHTWYPRRFNACGLYCT